MDESRLRLHTYFRETANYSAGDFVDHLERILKTYPGQPLFLLVDEDGSYHWTYIQQAGLERLDLNITGALQLPSAGMQGQNIRVFVVQIQLKEA